MSWNFKSNRPIYLQIAEKLRGDFLAGVYPPSSKFPTVRELALEASVNPNTMMKALQLLEQEGFLISHRTTGREVTANLDILQQKKEDTTEKVLNIFLQDMLQLGFDEGEALEKLTEFVKVRKGNGID